jgi:hypothetical protein
LRKEAEAERIRREADPEWIRKQAETKAENALQGVARALQQIAGRTPKQWRQQRETAFKAIQNAEKAVQEFREAGAGNAELERMDTTVKAAMRGLVAKAKVEEEIVGTWHLYRLTEPYTITVKIDETTGLYVIEPRGSNIAYDGRRWTFSYGGYDWDVNKVDANTFEGTAGAAYVIRVRVVRI